MALTNLNSVKDQAGISRADTTRDTQLLSLISGCTDLVKRYLNRDIESQSYTEYYSGDGDVELILRQFPVISVQRVSIDLGGYFGDPSGSFPSSGDLVAGVDYAQQSGQSGKGSSGILRRINGVWPCIAARSRGTLQGLPPEPMGNILVQYTAGFATIPASIQMAVNSLVIRVAEMASTGMAESGGSYEDFSVQYLTSPDAIRLLGTVERSLAAFKSIPI